MTSDSLVQHFVVHGGERIDWVVSSEGVDMTRAVEEWMDVAGHAADAYWLVDLAPDDMSQVPTQPGRPTFIVLDDYQPNRELDAAIVDLVARSHGYLGFVILASESPGELYEPLVRNGLVRITT
jgi:hypothetical protein